MAPGQKGFVSKGFGVLSSLCLVISLSWSVRDDYVTRRSVSGIIWSSILLGFNAAVLLTNLGGWLHYRREARPQSPSSSLEQSPVDTVLMFLLPLTMIPITIILFMIIYSYPQPCLTIF